MFKKNYYLILPVLSVAVCSLFLFTSLDDKIRDIFQLPMKSTNESSEIVMIAVDDVSVDEIGTWPFSRDVYGESLVTLKELGAEAVVFDLSFVDKSESKVDAAYVQEELPVYVDSGFESINEKIMEIMGYYQERQLGPDDAEDAAMELLNTTSIIKDSLETSISYVIHSQDQSLAEGLKYFDNSYVTLTFDNISKISDEEQDFLSSHIALENIEIIKDTKTPEYKNVLPAISDFMTNAKRAGFVNAEPDDDGYMRRLNLLIKFNGKYYGQLVFVPLLEHFGNPKVVVTDNYITLKNCRFPNMEIKDIKIPRAEDGSVLVKYPKNIFSKYNAISLWNIYRITLLEKYVKENLEYLNDSGYFDYYDGMNPYEAFSNTSYIREALKAEDEDATFEMLWSYRTDFLNSYQNFLEGNVETELKADYEDDEEFCEEIAQVFATCRKNFDMYMDARNTTEDIVRNSICIVGTSATSTTDYGINLYEEKYPNPGIHYSLANMIDSQDFIDDSPFWLSILVALIICFSYNFATHKIKSTGKQIVVGVSSLAASILFFAAFFIITKVYIGTAVPVIALAVDFIATSVIGFITASHDKRFITNAFSQCLSKEVVDDIVANPSSFKLGGQRLEMTAMFTDIQKFSAFSELLSASQLVALLNYYLTKMSDIIMDERGTVDKYEGDAIIALVGAPVKMDDHAQRACAAAIKMKKAEVEMNKEIQKIAAEPMPEGMDEDLYSAFKVMVENQKTIFTRIGLNSGEMIAGYMGSENKKNYTMMGNNVNLASRLEGVNKQYHTAGILISEATRNLLGDRFVVRSLDRVRVVNVNTPIRLYELIDERSEVSEDKVAYYNKWETALKTFENREYVKAADIMKEMVSENPRDSVARYYIALIDHFFAKGIYPTDKDDVGVEFNDEEFVFKLLQK